MHYDVDYAGMTPTRQYRQALLDCRAYCGSKEKFAKLRKILLAEDANLSLEALQLGLSLVGIQGYPVRALHQAYIASRCDHD